jgi:leucine dehydrogenase
MSTTKSVSGVFDHPDYDGHAQVAFVSDPVAGLRAILAIHHLGVLGAAGGGIRMWPYPDERSALRDALRLSRAMTYKLALADLPAGGAKAVVLGDPACDKREALLLALGRAIDRLAGRLIVGEDVGIGPPDLRIIARTTPFVARTDPDVDRLGAAATAEGVLVAMRVAVRRRLGRELAGLRVAVQGLGRVGGALCRELAACGAALVVTDLDPRAIECVARTVASRAVRPDAILDEAVDVFAPCAMGDAIDEAAAGRLRCAVVAGSANNPLSDARLAGLLAQRHITYAPDIVVNAGGALAAALGKGALLQERLQAIGPRLEAVLDRAERDRVSTHEAAERLAKERLAAQEEGR